MDDCNTHDGEWWIKLGGGSRFRYSLKKNLRTFVCNSIVLFEWKLSERNVRYTYLINILQSKCCPEIHLFMKFLFFYTFKIVTVLLSQDWGMLLAEGGDGGDGGDGSDGGDRGCEVDQGEVSTIRLGTLESSGFRKYSTLLVIQLFSRRLCLCHCLCIRLCLCICVPYSFLNSYYYKLSENVWVWGVWGN